jgi:hypothetical protein
MMQQILNDHLRRRSWFALSRSRMLYQPILFNNRINVQYTKRIISATTTMNIQNTGISSLPLVATSLVSVLSQQSYSHRNNQYYKNNIFSTTMTAILATATAIISTGMIMFDNQNRLQPYMSTTQCCGIAGVVGSLKNHDARYVTNNDNSICTPVHDTIEIV